MRIKKRDGRLVKIDLNKIKNRLEHLIKGVLPNGNYIGHELNIDADQIAIDVCTKVIDGIETRKLDEFAAEWCAYKTTESLDYTILASRIVISNHHKNTKEYAKFSDMMTELYENKKVNGSHFPLISKQFLDKVIEHKEFLDELVDKHQLDDFMKLNYFGFKTLERSYFIKSTKTQERLQHMLMRVAFFLYMDYSLLPEVNSDNKLVPPNGGNNENNSPQSGANIYMKEQVTECYLKLANFDCMFATPTLFNSGTGRPQLASCFLFGVHDSIKGMYSAVGNAAVISKWSGGIGIWLHDIRGNGAKIHGTNGISRGTIPYIKVINEVAKHVDQGGGKRPGAIALYMEPWHVDIIDFLDLRKNSGLEDKRARDIFTALYIPDIFMKRLIKAYEGYKSPNEVGEIIKWSLMDPNTSKGLSDVYGEEFEELYERYEAEGKYIKQVDIREIYQAIIDSQIETGTPYMLYKDHINRKSNQKNLGTIKSSNLCCEIVEYSSDT